MILNLSSLGTRIIYDRKFLLQMRNSPYSRTPPVRLATIPDIIAEGTVTVPPTTKSPDPIPPQGMYVIHHNCVNDIS